jgi:hypothetical protein
MRWNAACNMYIGKPPDSLHLYFHASAQAMKCPGIGAKDARESGIDIYLAGKEDLCLALKSLKELFH